MKTHLIMPMAGAGSRFHKNGVSQPKPLIRIEGKPFFLWAASAVEHCMETEDASFVILKEHAIQYGMDEEIKKYYKDAKIIMLDAILPGPVFSALRGIEGITDDLPIIINDCDHVFRCQELSDYMKNDDISIDAGVLTFPSDLPQYSYIRLDKDGNICGTVEKQVVSDRAVFGAYLFRSADVFRNAAEKYIKHCPYEECFMSGIYNELISEGRKVREFKLDDHVEYGTPDELKEAEKSDYFKKQ